MKPLSECSADLKWKSLIRFVVIWIHHVDNASASRERKMAVAKVIHESGHGDPDRVRCRLNHDHPVGWPVGQVANCDRDNDRGGRAHDIHADKVAYLQPDCSFCPVKDKVLVCEKADDHPDRGRKRHGQTERHDQ